ncbi:helix-turn-helix transcriptional regulator [Halococcus sp. IIIV-5B]|uniref:ArsR/SmtB family transcription factor n=1 Tax=Halococcus sp. IIIV-5B TaxID=2321230 RepID=UPI000E755C4A|nr:helix-turn-helix domain-containing protein [Halococcus sp. IIIV-5B]RJS98455.1 ArsR family transcriptional regulator [Halococcus sp. IIIV-5B]
MPHPPVPEEAPSAEVFAALSDPARVSILEALWAADDHTATFSALRTTVEMDDSGRFNYHLSKLRDRFVTRTDDGYRLRLAGIHVVGALLSGAYTRTESIEPITVDEPCPRCDGPMTFEYEDERVTVSCTDCEVVSMYVGVVPGVFADYDRETLPAVAERYTRTIIQQTNAGFCHLCEGRTNARLSFETPDTDLPDFPMVRYDCGRCGESITADLGSAFLDHPEVVAFYHDHDIDVRESSLWRFVAVTEDRARVLETDPLRIVVVYPAADEHLRLTLDEDLAVVAVDRG